MRPIRSLKRSCATTWPSSNVKGHSSTRILMFSPTAWRGYATISRQFGVSRCSSGGYSESPWP